MPRLLLFCAVLSSFALIFAGHAAHAAPSARIAAVCGGPLPSGVLTEPPRVAMAAQPLDDQGVHELILRVRSAGDRFCYRYAVAGVEEHRAPTIVVRPGEHFAIRIVNELTGPARGATMRASALAACTPQHMMAGPIHTYAGYMGHTIDARQMPAMADNDVNLHLHGFEGPASEDDVFLSTFDSPDRACEYTFTVPLTQPPGTYFYHPHIHGMADDEVGGGLAGTWIVLPPAPALPPADDHLVTLRYRIPYKPDGNAPDTTALFLAAVKHMAAMKPTAPVAFDPFAPPPWPSSAPVSSGATHLTSNCGVRSDSKLAVNGVDAPAELTVPANEPQLIRLVNVVSDGDAFLRARDQSGASQMLEITEVDGVPVGGDDVHPLSQFIAKGEYTLPAAGRVAMLFTLRPGRTIVLYSADICTAPFSVHTVPTTLLVLHAGPPSAHPFALATRPLDASHDRAAALIAYARGHRAQIRRRAFTYTSYLLPSEHGRGHSEYYLTETSKADFHEAPFFPTYQPEAAFPEPTVIVHRGTVEEWYLFNATMEVHSFHIHQMTFVKEGDATPYAQDTAYIPFGSLLPNPHNPAYPLIKPSLTLVLLDFRNVPRGTFVFHCHELFHEDRGMMGVIKVE